MAHRTEGAATSAPAGGRRPAARRTRSHRVLRRVLVGTLLVALAVGICAALMVRDALSARDALDEAAATVPEVEQSLRDSLLDPAAERPLADDATLAQLQQHTQDARDATDGPLWSVAAHLPVVGPSVHAATTVSSVLDDVSDVVLPALAVTGDAATSTRRDDSGGIDLAPLADAADDVTAARDVLAQARVELDDVDPAAIQPEFVEPVVTLSERLDDLDGLLAAAERATALLPPMLGADEPRRYVLAGLSNAELRTSGGIPGALMLLEVDDGKVSVTRQVSSGDVGPFREPVVPLDPDDEAAYSDRLARWVQDVTLTPDFATTAPILAAMWQRAQGDEVDGVVATDPVALSYLLEATGPVEVPLPDDIAEAVGSDSVEVRAETVVDLLLRRAYDVLDQDRTDEFFAVVAAAVFEQLTTSDLAPTQVLPALERAAESHRLAVWSADPGEQSLLDGTLMAGTFAADRAADAIGIFIDDTRSGKSTAYLDTRLRLAGSVCTGNGRADTVRLRLTNTMTESDAASLPFYVAGPEDDPDRGTLRMLVTAYGARDGDVPELRQDGTVVGGSRLDVHDRPTVGVTISLEPGESTTVTVATTASARAAHGLGTAEPGTLEVWSTPTAGTNGLHVLDVPICG
ncbi:DUF4012 domain-containing protein [Isoptericola aurantiacus]|uniref:DUF4012 domain-containing protein n=1 Tax=Isoptericola aurantiacus TaxID=3377839 RepID=UPI00383A88FF